MGFSSDSSDDQVSKPKKKEVSRRKKLQLKSKIKEKRTPPESEYDSDETVVIKNEPEQDIQHGGESDSTTGYPSPSRVTVAEVHAPENNDSDCSVILLG